VSKVMIIEWLNGCKN